MLTGKNNCRQPARVIDVDQAAVAAVLVDVEGEILAANSTFANAVGASVEHLVGSSLFDLIHPEDRALVDLSAKSATGEPTFRSDIESRYLHSSGAVLEMQESACSVAPAEGAPYRIVQLQDVTGRRAAATALRQREARLRLLIDQIPALIWSVDTDLRIASGVGSRLDLLDVRSTPDFSISLYEYLQTDDPEFVAIAAHRRALLGESVSFEMEWRGRVFRTHVDPLREAAGGPVIGAIGVASDITELKRAEDQLRGSEEKFRSLAETMSAAAFIFQGSRLVYANRAAQEMTEFTLEELERMSFWDVIHPLDRELARERGMLRQRGEAVPNRYEVRIVTKSNEERWVDYTGGAITYAGQPAVLGTAFDVTERKRVEEARRDSEERFRTAFEKSPLGLAVIDREKRLVDANDALCRMTGFDLEELRGFSIEEASHPSERMRNVGDLRYLLSGEVPMLQRERRLIRKNGDTGWFRLTASAVGDESGAPAYWLTMVEDITEQRHSEATAREHQAELSRVLRMRSLGELAAGLAHELNQPLSAVVSFAKGCVLRLRAGDLRPADLIEKLDQIADEALRARSIIRWVQRFLRKEAPRREPTDIRGLVANIVRLVETEARQKGIDIHVRVAAELPAVPVEAVQVEQVLFNLVRNGFDALEAQAAQGPEVQIGAEVRGANVEISVRDTGPGVGPGDPERIFEPFYSSKSGGMGLGLSISRSIVEAHGGRLWLGETGGGGATFRFSLPISPPADD